MIWKGIGMRRSSLGLLTGFVVLAFAASAKAELLYFLQSGLQRPEHFE